MCGMGWVCICHGQCVQVRSQLCGVRSLFHLYPSSRDQAQVIRLTWQGFHPQSHLASLRQGCRLEGAIPSNYNHTFWVVQSSPFV